MRHLLRVEDAGVQVDPAARGDAATVALAGKKLRRTPYSMSREPIRSGGMPTSRMIRPASGSILSCQSRENWTACKAGSAGTAGSPRSEGDGPVMPGWGSSVIGRG
jgi:hypothetical protein